MEEKIKILLCEDDKNLAKELERITEGERKKGKS